MIEIKNITKKFGNDIALDNVSFEITGGMNFIVGSSGSGKTTLLKIIGAMDNEYTGQIICNEKNLKELTNNELNNYHKNSVSFIWQEFNLIDNMTVFDNVKLPLLLANDINEKEIFNILRSLKMEKFAFKKVKDLSGGQKQRVAIARALIKNPDIIIADEPTGALDEKTSKEIMEILKSIAKVKTVIVVTHDTSLIEKGVSVFELDKGKLIKIENNGATSKNKTRNFSKKNLSLYKSFKAAFTNMKSSIGRYAVSALVLLLSTMFLVINFSGSVSSSGEKVFDELVTKYGNTLLDLTVVESFTGAAGTGGESGNKKPNVDVTQDISKVFEKFKDDDRIEYILSSQYFDDIDITLDGKSYKIASNGSAPAFDSIVEGSMPKYGENEVAVPESFVKKTGKKNSDIIGKTIKFKSRIRGKLIETECKVVGVLDTDMFFNNEYGGYTVEIEDAFYFSINVVQDAMKNAGLDSNNMPILIRAKGLPELIEIKDELNKIGIVPIGQFEMVEDIIRLNTTTKEQSGSANMIIGILAAIISVVVTLITSIMRKKEYAIYKINGFSNSDLFKINIAENLTSGVGVAILFVVLSPVLSKITVKLLGTPLQGLQTYLIGIIIATTLGLILGLISSFIAIKVNVGNALKTGER